MVRSKTNFSNLFDSFENTAFRLETLDTYSLPDEADDLQRFLSGEPLPLSTNREWCAWIRKNVELGKVIQRVHVVSVPLSPYVKFEINWRYVYNSAAGENIYVIEKSKVPTGIRLLTDYWLFDGRVAVHMRYDSNGRFLGGETDDVERSVSLYRDASISLMSLATPLKQFLAESRAAMGRV